MEARNINFEIPTPTRFYDIHLNAKQGIDDSEAVESLPLAKKLKRCEYLGKNILSADLLKKKLSGFRKNIFKLKLSYSHPTEIILSIIDENAGGDAWKPEEIANDEYFTELRMDAKTGLSRGYGDGTAGNYHKFLAPEEIAAGKVSADFSNDMEDPLNTTGYSEFVANYIQAFNKLRVLHGLPELKPDEYKI